MASYRKGDEIKVAATAIHRSSGSAYRGSKGKIVDVTGDGYVIRFDDGGWHAETVKDHEIEQA